MCKTKITGEITIDIESLTCDCGSKLISVGASPSQYRGASYMKSHYIAEGYIKCKDCGKIHAEFASR